MAPSNVNIGTVRRLLAVTAAVALLAGLGACTSSGEKAETTTSSTRSSASCPFQGELDTQLNTGYPAGVASVLTGVVPTTSGCVDQLRFNFNGALPPSTVGYSNAGAPTELVMQLGTAVPPNNVPSSVTYSGAASVPTGSLQHVKAMNVASANSVVTVTMTLDAQAQFLVSVSQKPQYIVVSLAHATGT
jgi:cellulase/cellobiase CelA1